MITASAKALLYLNWRVKLISLTVNSVDSLGYHKCYNNKIINISVLLGNDSLD